MKQINDKILEQYDKMIAELVINPSKQIETLEKFRWWLCQLLENVEINRLEVFV